MIVYTAIFGRSDSLKRPPPVDSCIAFTDDAELARAGWKVLSREKQERPRHAARKLKMSPHLIFPDADAWLWVDGSIEIRNWPLLLKDIGDADIACLPHPDRQTCYQEGETVIRLKIAADKGKEQVREALAKYRADGFDPKSLSTTGLFYRRNTPAVVAFNELWHGELNAYGTNDQVHVDWCAWKAGVAIKHLRGHYQANPYAVYDRADHHRRRQPQFLLEADCKEYLA